MFPPGSGPAQGPGVQLPGDTAPPGQPWNVLAALGMKGDGQAGGSAGWLALSPGVGPASPLLSGLCQAPGASTGLSSLFWGSGVWGGSLCPHSPTPCPDSASTRSSGSGQPRSEPGLKDPRLRAGASLLPETPGRCLGGVRGCLAATQRLQASFPTGGHVPRNCSANPSQGTWEPAPEGPCVPGPPCWALELVY